MQHRSNANGQVMPRIAKEASIWKAREDLPWWELWVGESIRNDGIKQCKSISRESGEKKQILYDLIVC